ncbi:YheC/YheD family protein [Paenibacillus xylaniclasticus]|uniref:YheC/YheD family protein n=1 Tax=Paenibacillus xylaniclasticus TaxID=588083 RepID=UPI000FDCA176|nr:YheC/YheD family protein [Paenibacillus xylaniclasticus]
MAIQRVPSKWAKTEVLLRSEHIRNYIPITLLFNRETLKSMLDRYGMVYVKPDSGSFGLGVIRVDKLSHDSKPYQFQLGKRIRRYSTFEDIYKALESVQKGRPYIVQRGISLLQHNNRRFDLRVMVQQNDLGEWETTGIIGRLGHPAKIVTNYHSGGTPLPLSTLMSAHMSEAKQRELHSRLSQLGLDIAKALQARYPRIKEIGVDVAIDHDFRPWVLEVNTRPDPFIFRKLGDPTVFHRIYRYCVGYGRYKKKLRSRK